MTKLTILAILSLVFIGVTRLAHFVLSLFVIVFFGFTTIELIPTFRQPAKRQYAE
jgi:predicted ABC-type exoprotein transport system permease subunit